jgi:hypothetical protein
MVNATIATIAIVFDHKLHRLAMTERFGSNSFDHILKNSGSDFLLSFFFFQLLYQRLF